MNLNISRYLIRNTYKYSSFYSNCRTIYMSNDERKVISLENISHKLGKLHDISCDNTLIDISINSALMNKLTEVNNNL